MYALYQRALADGAGRADVVLRWDDAPLPDGWLGRLEAAAAVDTNVACVVPVTGGAAVLEGAVHPRVLEVGPPLVYVRRSAIDLCGPLDGGFPQRCLEAGLVHVLADDRGDRGRAREGPGQRQL